MSSFRSTQTSSRQESRPAGRAAELGRVGSGAGQGGQQNQAQEQPANMWGNQAQA